MDSEPIVEVVEPIQEDLEMNSEPIEEDMYLKLISYSAVKYYKMSDLTAEENFIILEDLQESNNDGHICEPILYMETCGAAIVEVEETEVEEYHFEYDLSRNKFECYLGLSA